jgi:quinol monooxygenase YgiN
MNTIERSVSIHPYFKVRAGQMDTVKALLREFAAKTTTEEKALYYEFTINGDMVFCREAYVGAEGALAHLENVGPLLDRMLTLSDLTRLEIHGPAGELEKLKAPLGKLNPAWFTYECGMTR